MKLLNIVDSWYTGEDYVKSCRVLVDPAEVFLIFKYDISRMTIPLPMGGIKVDPYKIDYATYTKLLSRVNLKNYKVVGGNFSLYSKDSELMTLVGSYGRGEDYLMEPSNLQDLLYEDKNISPLGVVALLYRRCYGNENFKRLINSTLLKEYAKVKLRGETLYVKGDVDVEFLRRVSSLFPQGWESVREVLLTSPDIFIWRD